MPEVTVKGDVFDCMIWAVDPHSGYIVEVARKKSEEKKKQGKPQCGDASACCCGSNEMIRYCLMVFRVLSVICCGMGSECRFAANAIRLRRVRCQFVRRSNLLQIQHEINNTANGRNSRCKFADNARMIMRAPTFAQMKTQL